MPSSSSGHDSATGEPPLNVQSSSKEADALDKLNGGGDKAGYGDWMTATKPRQRQTRRPTVGVLPTEKVAGRGSNHPPTTKTTKVVNVTESTPSGSRFTILTDTLDEEAPTAAPEVAVNQPYPASTTELQKKNEGQKKDSQKAKGKAKSKEFVSAASNEAIFADIRPLNKEPITQKMTQEGEAAKAVSGPCRVLNDITNVQSPSHTTILKNDRPMERHLGL